MKCTNCGKNNAVNHYRYEINGQVTEAHLCADCARELQPEREFAARSREMFGGMLDDGFFGRSLFDERPGRGLLGSFFGGDPFEDFFGGFQSPFAMLGMPRIEITFPEAQTQSQAPEQGAPAEQGQQDPELAKKRRINELREQMRAAAEREDYESAAMLRDQLKKLEGEKSE